MAEARLIRYLVLSHQVKTDYETDEINETDEKVQNYENTGYI